MQIMFRCFQIVLLVVALAGLFVSSWGACVPNPYLQNQINNITFPSPNTSNCYRDWQLTNCCNRLPELCSNNQWPQSGGSCPHVYNSWPGYYTNPIEQCSNPSGCNPGALLCAYQILCDTRAEADSVNNALNCDKPENWKCSTSSSIVKVQETSPDIVCDVSFGGCYSGNACAIYTEYSTTCKNECSGDSTVESYRTDPIWQDGFCDEVDIDRDDCGPTRCIDMDGNFSLVHDCNSNNVVNGEIQRFPVVIMGGKGSCASNGYQPVNPDSLGNNGNSSNRDSILQALQDSLYSQDCLLFGKCPSYNDSTDFSNPENRSPQNGCYCEYIDNTGVVTCPDGSTQILGMYVRCNIWENHFSSSSTPSSDSQSSDSQSSNSQSSSSGGGGSSVADPRPTDWANWSQANEMNDKLDVNNSFLMSISNKLSNIFSWLTSSGASVSRDTSSGLGSIDWDSPVFVDSSYLYDTTTYSVFNDVADSLFSLAEQNKGLIDTSSVADVSGCFTCRFIFPRGLGGQRFEVNFGSLGGFNICRILRSLLIILTEIACLLMLFSSFIKGGKS